MKIDTIMSNLRDNTNTNTQDEFIEHTPLTNLTLTEFEPVTTDYVKKLLAKQNVSNWPYPHQHHEGNIGIYITFT